MTLTLIKTMLKTFTAQDAGTYSQKELKQFWNRVLLLNTQITHCNSLVKVFAMNS